MKRLVHKYGTASSEALLESPCLVFSTPEVEGVIGYREQSKFAVTFGDPLCSENDIHRLTSAFHQFCQAKNFEIIYMIVSEKFAKYLMENQCKVMIEIGEELVFDPQHDVTKGHNRQKLRNYLRSATHAGLNVHEYLNFDEKLEQSIQQVGIGWLKGRRGPQIHLGTLDFFKDRTDKRWFYMQKNDQLLGMALLSKIESRNGWFLKFLMTIPNSPRGASDLLMMSILNVLRDEKCNYLTFGIIPVKNLNEIVGLGQIITSISKLAFKVIKRIFHLDQRKFFWKKFDPKSEKSYVLFTKQSLSLSEILALVRSLKIDI